MKKEMGATIFFGLRHLHGHRAAQGLNPDEQDTINPDGIMENQMDKNIQLEPGFISGSKGISLMR